MLIEWVSVKEALPNKYKKVLIYGNYPDEKPEVLFGFWCKSDKSPIEWLQGYEGNPNLTDDNFNIISWADLPWPD